MGRRVNGATDVIKNATVELKRFTENIYQEYVEIKCQLDAT